jgi:hypothetical protein
MFPQIFFYLITEAEIVRMADSRAEFYNDASNACVLKNTA